MDKEYIFDTIRQLIGSGKTGEVFDFLREQSLDPSIARSLAIIEGAYKELRQAEIKGVLTSEAIQAKKNQINDKILVLPFVKVGPQDAKPQIVLRDRINQL